MRNIKFNIIESKEKILMTGIDSEIDEKDQQMLGDDTWSFVILIL